MIAFSTIVATYDPNEKIGIKTAGHDPSLGEFSSRLFGFPSPIPFRAHDTIMARSLVGGSVLRDHQFDNTSGVT